MTVNYHKIIVPLDGSRMAECVLPHAEALALTCQVKTLELVCVVNPIEVHIRPFVPFDEKQEKEMNLAAASEAEEYLSGIKATLAAKGINTTSRVLSGATANTLADYIAQSGADLVVISTHGRSGPSRWAWGSIADRLLHATCTPIMMVRTPGCVPDI
jgi:nucleotide-binding universal stress UspA family protein